MQLHVDKTHQPFATPQGTKNLLQPAVREIHSEVPCSFEPLPLALNKSLDILDKSLDYWLLCCG